MIAVDGDRVTTLGGNEPPNGISVNSYRLSKVRGIVGYGSPRREADCGSTPTRQSQTSAVQKTNAPNSQIVVAMSAPDSSTSMLAPAAFIAATAPPGLLEAPPAQ